MNLQIVLPGKVLHQPYELDRGAGLWLREGGVVDLDDAYTAHCVRGQEYKLGPAPAGSVVSPIPTRAMELHRESFNGVVRIPPKTSVEVAREDGEQRADKQDLIEGIERPVIQRKKVAPPS